MNLRYMNRIDLIVIGASVLTLIIFFINRELNSVIPLYLNGLTVLSIFTYWSIRSDPVGMLRRSLIIGGIGGSFYTFVDKLFVESRTITYIAYINRGTEMAGGVKDIEVFATPASVVLVWICCITIGMYLYQRMRSVFGNFYIPAVLTGASAFLSAIVLNHLGSRIWVWNFGIPASPGIGSTPLFVPVALFFTFLFSPYIVGGQRISRRVGISDNPIAAGLRCAVIMSMMVYLSFRIFTG